MIRVRVLISGAVALVGNDYLTPPFNMVDTARRGLFAPLSALRLLELTDAVLGRNAWRILPNPGVNH